MTLCRLKNMSAIKLKKSPTVTEIQYRKSTASNKEDNHALRSWIRKWAIAVVFYLFGGFALLVGVLLFGLSKLQLVILKHCICPISGKSLNILNGTDAALLYIFPSASTNAMCPAIIQLVMIVKGEPNLQSFAKRLRDVVALESRTASNGKSVTTFPKLTQKVVRRFGYYVWEEDDHFTLDSKVRLSEEGYTDETTLMQLVQNVYERPLLDESPLWECVLLPKLSRDSKKGVKSMEHAILWRIHHCMSDGNTAVRMCSALFDKTSVADRTDIPQFAEQKQPLLIQNNALFQYLVHSGDKLTVPKSLNIILNTISLIFKAPWHVMKNALQEPEYHALHQSKSTLDGRRLFAITDSIPIKVLKDIGQENNCTVNDVFLLCAAGSFQRQDYSARIPTSNHLRLSMAIHVLPPGDLSQNGMTSAILSIPLTNDRSADWLKCISKTSQEQKSSSALVNYFLINLAMGNHFPRTLVKSLTNSSDICSLATTNLRGPATANTILGNPVKDFFLLPNILASAAVSFSLLSYNGRIRVGVAVDLSVARNVQIAQQLARDFVEELKNLKNMANDTIQTTRLQKRHVIHKQHLFANNPAYREVQE